MVRIRSSELMVKEIVKGSSRRFDSDAERWRALQRRAAEAEGRFLYAVKTTKVYCRPTCAARLALRENVLFFDSCEAAERAGFRACKRCRPMGKSQAARETEAVRRVCRLIEGSEVPLKLEELAKTAGFSRFHFLRLFKKIIGLSPRQYAVALRDGRMRSELKKTNAVTEAVYAAGYNASSRFYERSSALLGMRPKEYRAGGRGLRIQYAIVKSTLGLVLVAGTERGICCVHFGESREQVESHLRTNFSRAEIVKGSEEFRNWVKLAVREIEGDATADGLPLDVKGTVFQHRVWQALREIPVGQTLSYMELAAKIGNSGAVRAVARACATNPIAVVVPCHRVVRSDGDLAGYRWGLDRKRKLLEREKGARIPSP